MLKNVIRDGREVDNIEEEGNVRVALETAVTRELARKSLGFMYGGHTTGTGAGPALGA